MRKIFAFVLVFIAIVWAITSYTTPYPPTSGALIKSSEMKANLDTGAVWSSRIVDSLAHKFIRFNSASAHDSTLKYINIDTIRSSPNIDTVLATPMIVKGRIVYDTLAGTRASAMLGIFDTVGVRSISAKLIDSVATQKVVSSDSVKGKNIIASDSLISGKGARITGILRADSLVSVKGIGYSTLNAANIVSDSAHIAGLIVSGTQDLAGLLYSTTGAGFILGDHSQHNRWKIVRESNWSFGLEYYGSTWVNPLYVDSTGNLTASKYSTSTGYAPMKQEGTFACSLFAYQGSIDTFKVAGTARYVKIDSLVTIWFSNMKATMAGGLKVGTIPSNLRPTNSFTIVPIVCNVGGHMETCKMECDSLAHWNVLVNGADSNVYGTGVGFDDGYNKARMSVTYYKY